MIDTKLLTDLAANASFTQDAIFIDLPKTANFQSLIISLENTLALWAKLMDKKLTVVRSLSGEVKIPASLAVPLIDTPASQDKPSKLLWFANVAISPGLLLIANDLMNNPRKAGVTRLSDELQIIMSDGCSILNPGHSMQEACTWTRSQFWDAQDLDDFRREVRQQGENVFEYSWKSFDPTDPTKTNDLEFTTRYKLFNGGDGQMYQLCENLEMRTL